MVGVKSGNSATASPNLHSASRPGAPEAVLMGMRDSNDSSASKSGGSWTTGSERGRKPLVVDTMNAGRESSFGLVSVRTLNLGAELEIVMLDLGPQKNWREFVVLGFGPGSSNPNERQIFC